MTISNHNMFKINEDWCSVFNSEFEQTYFKSLLTFIKHEYSQYSCCPTINKIFTAFNLCNYKNLKVVILGQDPYHAKGQANGLAFSVNSNICIPPSLRNIYKELQSDLKISRPNNGDLSAWASQGVLLLNTTLTVRESMPGSHQKNGWEEFTNHIIQTISNNNSNLVFMLWGTFAHKKDKLINVDKHLVLKSGHPSPLSANRGYWFGNRHFSKANNYLKLTNQNTINW